MRYRVTLACAAAFVLLTAIISQAAVPTSIHVQGRLTDAGGVPLPIGQKAFLFKIFDMEVGGTEIWPGGSGEIQFRDTDANGLWAADMGAVNPIPESVFADSVRWLEIAVNDGVNPPVTLPRTRLLTGPYAFSASRVTSVDGATGGAITDKVSIGPGHTNTGDYTFVAGDNNNVTGHHSTVGGGFFNTASGAFSTIAGGLSNDAAGDYSVALGRRAKANHIGTFVWADSTNANFNSSGPNQFLIRANGGVGIGTTVPLAPLHVQSSEVTTGYFTSNRTNVTTAALKGEYTGGPTDARGVLGISTPDDYWGIGGEFFGGFIGVRTWAQPTGGETYYGLQSRCEGGSGTNYGVHTTAEGTGDSYGLWARTQGSGTNYAIYGVAEGGTTNWAGYFQGDVNVTGTLVGGASASKIDHPLDPENKYLNQSSVESPDMMNVYNGNVTTDANGSATVQLPDYVAELNSDFRYQLTVIGQFAQAIVAEEIVGTQFVIRTDKSNVKVSWQVTGIRQDAFAAANRVPVEELKSAAERGLFKYPKAFGQPLSKSIDHVKQQESRDKKSESALR